MYKNLLNSGFPSRSKQPHHCCFLFGQTARLRYPLEQHPLYPKRREIQNYILNQSSKSHLLSALYSPHEPPTTQQCTHCCPPRQKKSIIPHNPHKLLSLSLPPQYTTKQSNDTPRARANYTRDGASDVARIYTRLYRVYITRWRSVLL